MTDPGIRGFVKLISTIVLCTLLYNSFSVSKWSHGGGVHEEQPKHRRFMLGVQQHESISSNVSALIVGNDENTRLKDLQICADFFDHKGYNSSCDFLIARPDCTSGGFLNYIKFFYCDCKNYSFFGYLVLGAWLAVLFYLLGNTAADYFCCSIENLSNLLKMSPTIAGVTLLPLGNGASDVFSSIAAFVGTGSGDVGLNGVLGGAVFVTCIVVGVISISVADKKVQIDKKCFIRDLCFFLFTILCLAVILIIGKITIWGAIAFVSIYLVYVVYVGVSEVLMKKVKVCGLTPLLPVVGSYIAVVDGVDESVITPLISSENQDNSADFTPKLQHCVWNNHYAMYSDYIKAPVEESHRAVWGWSDEGGMNEPLFSFANLCWLLEMPLSVPRRLTIPIVEEDRWSKMYAVASAFLSPLLLAFLWNIQENEGPFGGKMVYIVGFVVGLVLSILASLFTSTEHPPRRCLFPWIFGGFFMSIIWFYIIADELVSLLVSLGTILGINPSMLALTVLAWGNSMNDLMSNTAFAMNERDGVQIAMSGSFAGPMFNTLVGLGLSLVLGTWSKRSEPYVIPGDAGLYLTMAFLTASIIWSLVVLPRIDMRPNKVLGVGLIIMYVLFLSIRITMAIGFGSSDRVGL